MRGLIRVMEYLQAGGKLEPLLLGKIALKHVDITTELLWRKILKPPRVVPRYLESTQALVRLDKIKGCENVMGLLTEQLL